MIFLVVAGCKKWPKNSSSSHVISFGWASSSLRVKKGLSNQDHRLGCRPTVGRGSLRPKKASQVPSKRCCRLFTGKERERERVCVCVRACPVLQYHGVVGKLP